MPSPEIRVNINSLYEKKREASKKGGAIFFSS
jgi:hypothetical protein